MVRIRAEKFERDVRYPFINCIINSTIFEESVWEINEKINVCWDNLSAQVVARIKEKAIDSSNHLLNFHMLEVFDCF